MRPLKDATECNCWEYLTLVRGTSFEDACAEGKYYIVYNYSHAI